MNIICIGHVAFDSTFSFSTFPSENTKNRASLFVEGCGGGALTASYQLAKWGLQPYLIGTIGDDIFGSKIKEELQNTNVNITYLQTNPTVSTTRSTIVINQEKGSRTIYSYVAKGPTMKDISLKIEPDFILVDGYEAELSKKIITRYPNAISVLDASKATKDVLELCKQVNYVVCSKSFLEEATSVSLEEQNKETYIKAYRTLEEICKTTIVATLESKGALYKYHNQVRMMPSIKVQAVDTTGAGDVFHAAFLYGLYKNLPFEEIVKMSNVAGALAVTKLGSSASTPSTLEMKKVYHDFE